LFIRWYYTVHDYCFRLLALSQPVQTDASVPDELLFGRSGYLLALLFVRHHLGTESVPQAVIRQVSIGARNGEFCWHTGLIC